MAKQLIALGLFIIVVIALFSFFRGGREILAGAYQNDEYGYSLTVPRDHSLTENTDEYQTIGDKAEVRVIRAPQANFENFETFLITELSNTCAADGVSESISCDRITRAESFTAQDGLPGGVVYLNRIHSDLSANASTTAEFGPIFLFSLPPASEEESNFTVLIIRPPANAPSNEIDEAFIREVAESVRLNNQNNE